MKIRCPHCRHAIELLRDERVEDLTCPSCQSKVDVSAALSLELGKTATITYAEDDVMPKPGEEIGHFRIERELGKGGFGSVYSAFDLQLERRVAIKIPRMLQMKKWQAEVFVREARAAAQLRDPNIVGVHEVGRDKDRVYIVSDLIDGITLREWMEQARPDARTAARMISKIAKAIHRAHQCGIIHRDLKPRNILVDFNAEPHITDFGLAKRESPEEITVAADGQVIGTPAYMSPEQISGKSQQADARTDVYALGVVLYEMLTGTRPYRGDSDLLVNEITAGNPTPPRLIDKGISKDLEAICLRAMSREPGKRFLSASDLSADLDRFVSGQPTMTRPPGVFKRTILSVSRHKYAAGIFGLALFGLAGWMFTWLRPGRESILGETATTRVRILYEPPDAQVQVLEFQETEETRIAKAVPVNGLPEIKAGACDCDLPAGMYQIRLYHPRFGHQTFLRRVPDTLDEFRRFDYIKDEKFTWAYNNYEKLGDNEIKWQVLRMKPQIRGDADTIRLGPTILKRKPSGAFVSGPDTSLPEYQFPNRNVEMDQYYVGETEVTVAEFQSVMGFLPDEIKDANLALGRPVSFVNWQMAVEYCERIGGRLPSFDEYVYACNQGTTRFPWGDDVALDATWQQSEVKQPTFDVTPGAPSIFNLFSSQLEWTADRFVLPVRHDASTGRPKPFPPEVVSKSRNSRLLVGGPLEPEGVKYAELLSTRVFEWRPIDERRREYGFRVYLDDPNSPADVLKAKK